MTDKTPQFNTEDAESVISGVKTLGTLIKEKKYFRALKEFFVVFYAIYKKHIKGKYIEFKGKKVPMAAVLLVVLAGGFAVAPSGNENADKPTSAQEQTKQKDNSNIKEKEDMNTYNQDGVKVYGLVKCGEAVCGYVENDSDNDISRILISLTFHDKTGAVVYEGGAEATAMVAKSRSRLKITTEGDFDYFVLSDVTVEK